MPIARTSFYIAYLLIFAISICVSSVHELKAMTLQQRKCYLLQRCSYFLTLNQQIFLTVFNTANKLNPRVPSQYGIIKPPISGVEPKADVVLSTVAPLCPTREFCCRFPHITYPYYQFALLTHLAQISLTLQNLLAFLSP